MEKKSRDVCIGFNDYGAGNVMFTLAIGDFILKNITNEEAMRIRQELNNARRIIESSHSHKYDVSTLRHMQTVNMESVEEIQDWERDCEGLVIQSDSGGVLELSRIERICKANSCREYFLNVAACDDEYETGLCLAFSSKNEVRRLRDYLNTYLEV